MVPSGAKSVSITTAAGTGDADLYVEFGSAPTTTSYLCRSYTTGNAESCTFSTNPTPGTYYVLVKAYSAVSGLTVNASYSQ